MLIVCSQNTSLNMSKYFFLLGISLVKMIDWYQKLLTTIASLRFDGDAERGCEWANTGWSRVSRNFSTYFCEKSHKFETVSWVSNVLLEFDISKFLKFYQNSTKTLDCFVVKILRKLQEVSSILTVNEVWISSWFNNQK